jgi:hypothetical protein
MFGSSVLTVLWILWAAATAVFSAVMIWRSLVGSKEEDVLFLAPAEERMAEEQREIVARVERLTSYAMVSGISSVILLVALGSVWLFRGLGSFRAP